MYNCGLAGTFVIGNGKFKYFSYLLSDADEYISDLSTFRQNYRDGYY